MRRFLCALVVMLCCAPPLAADPIADFYTGRTVMMVVGSTAGGSYDLNARTLAPLIARHLPGHPSIVVQNMLGAGGIIGANYVVNVAPKDGTVISASQRLVAFDPLFGDPGPKYDPLALEWLGSSAKETGIVAIWHTAPQRSFADLRAQELIVGGTQPGTDTVIYANVLNNVLHTRLKIVPGYAGSVPILLAMERGEVQGIANWSWSDVNAVRPGWVRDGKIHIPLILGMQRIPELPDVPTALEVASGDDERKVTALLMQMKDVGRPFFMAPGVPRDRFEAMETAFMAALQDPDFVAAAKREGREVEPVSGREMTDMLKQAYALPPPIIAAAQRAVKSPGAK